jgi:hypothetical protein
VTSPAVLPNLAGVPALTLHQPWAHAIAHLGKRVECRCWQPPAHIRRILIHAGKADSPAGWVMLRQLGFAVQPETVAASAIVAVADLAGVCSDAVDGGPCGCSRWAMPGQHHWLLGTVWPLARPVPCPGRQRLWYPGADVLAQVQAAGVEVSRA